MTAIPQRDNGPRWITTQREGDESPGTVDQLVSDEAHAGIGIQRRLRVSAAM